MKYEERLRALGRLADERNFVDIQVMEQASGFILNGLMLTYNRNGEPLYEPATIRVPLSKAATESKTPQPEEAKKGMFGWSKR